MEFDRNAPGSGLEIDMKLQGGKAYLEGRLHLREKGGDTLSLPFEGEAYLDIGIWDRENRLVFSCRYPLCQEEPMKGIILHPKLWQGTEDPYLYRVRAVLIKNRDSMADVLEKSLALRNFCEIPLKGWFLNERPFPIRAVEYEVPTQECCNPVIQQIRRDLEQIREMGANVVCPIGNILVEDFGRVCEELGLVVFSKAQMEKEVEEKSPRFVAGTRDFLKDTYYYYKASWGKEPFVYISRDSFVLTADKSARIVVYSNQKKVALYVDGVLFEFRTEGPDFIFEEIPINQLPILLTAETAECSMSVTIYPVHRKFTK